ncbi:unnamed protein product [Bemisia tabaci]|uniref:Uncharacterized protein n=1 Tax=Bemisia tabaci TaxID=7038 RepID=A0A9P0APA1_BEMTA|nr:unnamed protein product [Bemisia tabaci]
MSASVGFALIVGLLCLNECGGQGQPVFVCNELVTHKIPRGALITTVPRKGRTWCGQEEGQFLAVAENILFHLRCSEGVKKLNKAVAAISNLAELTAGTLQIFQDKDKCRYSMRGINTGSNALVLAEMLDGHTLNFDGNYCNASHYIDYLSNGQVTILTANKCPVFKSFNHNTHIIAPPQENAFQLEGRYSYFVWPRSLHSGALVEKPKPIVKPGQRSLSESNSSSSWGHVVDKKGGFGGSVGGRGARIPRYIPGHGGSTYHSSASRAGGQPLWGFKLPSFKSFSFSKSLRW